MPRPRRGVHITTVGCACAILRRSWPHTRNAFASYTPDMDILRAATEDIRLTARRWHAQCAALGVDPPRSAGLPCQSSAAAVNAAHAAITIAAASLTGRVQASATKVAQANTGYRANEAKSAAQIAAVADRARDC